MKNEGGFSLRYLSDEKLIAELGRVSRAHRGLTAGLVAHIAEMDARGLYRSEATPSMFVYCVRKLGFSEDEACRRIDAARVARKWPMIFAKIGTGELSLSVIGKLKPFLDEENAAELVGAVCGKSVREAERILAARFPKPDVADSVRRLPDKSTTTKSNGVEKSDGSRPTVGSASAATDAAGVTSPLMSPSDPISRSAAGASGSMRGAPLPADRGRMQPLSADRIQVKFTASRALEEKLGLARDLMSHSNPRGDLATIVEAALDLLIADRLKKKLGQTKRKRTQKSGREAKRTHVTNETRREVLERDGLGCVFVSARGERCGARAFLELDHVRGKEKGSGAPNVRILCRAHNQLEAERRYWKAHMERSRRKKRELEVRESVSTNEFVVGGIVRGVADPVGIGWWVRTLHVVGGSRPT
jgi:hypothetical protein